MSARGGASGSPAGCGTWSTMVLSSSSTPSPVFAETLQHLARVAADDGGQLLRVALGLGGREVDLVEHRDDLEVGVDGQVEVGQRLRLDALRGVDEQDGALAGLQAPADLVGEVDVAGGVDHVQDVVGAVLLPGQPDRLALDRDAALALDVHPVQVLGAHLPPFDDAGQLQHPVGQGGLAVVDVRDDAEVADHGLVGAGRCRGFWLHSLALGSLGRVAHCHHASMNVRGRGVSRAGSRRTWPSRPGCRGCGTSRASRLAASSRGRPRDQGIVR